MISVIGRLLVLAANLVEAEGRVLRANVARFVANCALAGAAFACAALGVALLLLALFLAVAAAQGYTIAALVCGLVCLVIAGGLGWFISAREPRR